MPVRKVAAAFACALCLSLGGAQAAMAAPYADFKSDIEYQRDGKQAKKCGTTYSAENFVRMDVELGKAGEFTFLVDMKAGMLRVLSRKLHAYVEVPVAGNARSWRDIVQSAAAAVMPQSMGMITLQEKEYARVGKGSWKGYSVQKSRCVYEASFMGKSQRFTFEVWENTAFAPFPMRASSAETKAFHGGSAWLSNIAAEQAPADMFRVPENFTRYTSIMDLLLYALTAF